MNDDETERIAKAGQNGAFDPNDHDDDDSETDIPKIPTLGERVKEGAKKVGGAIAEGVKNVGEKAIEGAKDIGGAVGGAVKEKAGEAGAAVKEKAGEAARGARGAIVDAAVNSKAGDRATDLEEFRGIAQTEDKGEDTGGANDGVEKPAETWNETVTDDWERGKAFDEARRQARAAQKEKRHMAMMNSAKAIAPQLVAAGVKSYADMLGNVRTLTNNFLNGQGMSTASTLLGETLASADTAGNMLKRSSQDFGILQNADMEAIKGTAKGRMMMARNKAEQEGIAFANVMIGKALTDPDTGEQKDISQLDMDDVLKVYNECRAGMQRAQQIIQEPDYSKGGKYTRGDKQHAAGMLQQYRDVLKGLDSRNKDLGKMAREEAAWMTTQQRDANRQQRALSAAELKAKYDAGSDVQKWVWDNLNKGNAGLDLDDDGVPRDPRKLGPMIKQLDAKILDMEQNGMGPNSASTSNPNGAPEYIMLTGLRDAAIARQNSVKEIQDARTKEGKRQEDETYGGYESRRKTINTNNKVISDLYERYGLPNDGRTLKEYELMGDTANADRLRQMMQDPEFIHAQNEIAYNNNANMIDDLRRTLYDRGAKFGIPPDKVEAIIAKMKGIQTREIQTRKDNEEQGLYTDPESVSELRDYNEFYSEVLNGRVKNTRDRLQQKLREREVKIPESQRQFDGEWHALNDAIDALEMTDPGDDPKAALEARDVAYAQAGVRIEGARARERERKAKKKAEDKKKETTAQRDAERHRKASEGKMSYKEFDEYVKELQQKADAGGKNAPKYRRQIEAARVGQSYKNISDLAGKMLGGGYITNDQHEALMNHVNGMKDSMLSVYNGEGRRNYRVPKSTIDEWTRVGRYIKAMNSKENSDLRSRMRGELDKRKFDEDDSEKQAIQDLYDVLTDTTAISSTNGDTRDYQTRVDDARKHLKQVREDNIREAMESTEAAGTASKQRAAINYSMAEMNRLVEEAGFGMLPSYDIDEISDPEIREFMTTDPNFIKAHNRWVNNRNQQLYDSILKKAENKNLGWDSAKLMSMQSQLQILLDEDKAARAGNDQYVDPKIGFGKVAAAYRDILDGRLENLNDKNDINLRSLENQIKQYEQEHANESLSDMRNNEKYRLMVELRDALSDGDITPFNVVEKANHIRDLRAKLLKARGPTFKEEKPKTDEEKSGPILTDQAQINQALQERDAEEAFAQPAEEKPKSVINPGSRHKTDAGKKMDMEFDAAIESGMFSEADRGGLRRIYNAAVQTKSLEDAHSAFNKVKKDYEYAKSLGNERKMKLAELGMKALYNIAEERKWGSGLGTSQDTLKEMDDYIKSLDQSTSDVPAEDTETSSETPAAPTETDDQPKEPTTNEILQSILDAIKNGSVNTNNNAAGQPTGNRVEQLLNDVEAEEADEKEKDIQDTTPWTATQFKKYNTWETDEAYRRVESRHPEIKGKYQRTEYIDANGKKEGRWRYNPNKKSNSGTESETPKRKYDHLYSGTKPIDTSDPDIAQHLDVTGWTEAFESLNSETDKDKRKALAPILGFLADPEPASRIVKNWDKLDDAKKKEYNESAIKAKQYMNNDMKDLFNIVGRISHDDYEIKKLEESAKKGKIDEKTKNEQIQKINEEQSKYFQDEELDDFAKDILSAYHKIASRQKDAKGNIPPIEKAIDDATMMKIIANNVRKTNASDISIGKLMGMIVPQKFFKDESSESEQSDSQKITINRIHSLSDGWQDGNDWISDIISKVDSKPKSSTGAILDMLSTIEDNNVTNKAVLQLYTGALNDLHDMSQRSSGRGLKGEKKEAYAVVQNLIDTEPQSLMKAALALALKRAGSGDTADILRAAMRKGPTMDYTTNLTKNGEAIAKSHSKKKMTT